MPRIAPISYGVKAPWSSLSKGHSLNVMELIHSTDYFAAIPHVAGNGLLKPNQPVSDQAFRQRTEADFSLVALVATTVVAVATLALNWAR
jgi:hypothetical protein